MHNNNYTTAEEAAKLIKSGDSIYIQGSCATPHTLVQAIADRGNELREVKVYSTFTLGKYVSPLCKPEYRDSFLVRSFFLSSPLRQWVADGYGEVVPCFFNDIPELIRKGHVKIDVAVLNVSLPDNNGYCSYGVAAEVNVAAVECAKVVIAQVNPKVPYCYGDAMIHVSRIDAMVSVDEELFQYPETADNSVSHRIGKYVSELIPDGATLQIGVGSIPNAILSALHDHKHLGLHTEAITEGVIPLIESGVIDNSMKHVMPGKTVATLAIGTDKLYNYIDHNRDVLMRDVAWTNSPHIISSNDKVMAVNSAIEIDITGQVCADSIGTFIYSSVGGQHDFMYGGALSNGGKTFIVMPSATSGGVSKIKALLTPGAGVATTRFQTQYVVTEYGVASLLGKGLAERARALIDISHPTFREELERAAFDRFGYAFSRLKSK